MSKLVVSEAFSENPGGRYLSDGPFSGEEFRENCLLPYLKDNPGRAVVVLDGTRGYPSSFLDEAFAGLLRKHGWTKETFHQRIEIEATGPFNIYKDDILQYVDDEEKRSH